MKSKVDVGGWWWYEIANLLVYRRINYRHELRLDIVNRRVVDKAINNDMVGFCLNRVGPNQVLRLTICT